MTGRLHWNIRERVRVAGGIDEVSMAQAVEFSSPVLTAGMVIPMTTTGVAKTAENTFCDLQIVAVNQLALSFEAMGINFYACPGRGGVAQG